MNSNGRPFEFSEGGYHFIGEFYPTDRASPEFEDLGTAINYFITRISSTLASTGNIPPGAELDLYVRGLKLSADFAYRTSAWTHECMTESLRILERWVNADTVRNTMRVSIRFLPFHTFLFSVSRVPNQSFQLTVSNTHTATSKFLAHKYPSDSFPSLDALEVLNACLQWAVGRTRAGGIAAGERRVWVHGAAQLRFTNGSGSFAYTYMELALLLGEIEAYFGDASSNPWPAFSGFIQRDGYTIAQLTLSQASGISESNVDAAGPSLLNASAIGTS